MYTCYLNTVQAVIKELCDNYASSRREVGQIFDNLSVVERQRHVTLSELDHAFENKDVVLKHQASI